MAPLNNPLSPPAGHPNTSLPGDLRAASFAAMGTTISILAPAQQLDLGLTLTRDLFAEWEATLSRFRPASELSQLNASAGRGMVLSPLLLTVLEEALAAAVATDGIFDPTLLPQLRQAGYDQSFASLPIRRPALDVSIATQPGGAWRDIIIDHRHGLVIMPPGTALDFGGIAKGMAVDAALDRLAAAGITSALVNAGGDLGVRGLPTGLDHWPVAVPGDEVLALRGGALATSGIERHNWWRGATFHHHLLDPRTGESTRNGLWSATVTAERCGQAEVAAKVAFILGPVSGSDFLEHIGLAGLLIPMAQPATFGHSPLSDPTNAIMTRAWPRPPRDDVGVKNRRFDREKSAQL